MKPQISLALLASLAAASPINEQRQLGGSTENGLRGPCKDIAFIFARGSTEIGNMGTICGPPTADRLRDEFGEDKVAVQGVNYPARLSTNFLPSGGDPDGVRDMTSHITDTVSKCPETIIVAGGYSQGAAITHETVKSLDSSVIDRIAGIVTFGDTQNKQDNGRIPNYPPEQTKIICAPGDLVCEGTLIITPAHLGYTMDAREAAEHLISMIKAAQA
ncbi:hypothetical protein AJ79_05195 [Helicocarpus griseus UAMH5409]|uniref:Cutinase n=1 Tax=Helicocarpus griseus UAMH5409 TaxID=1447875 RepID=A0A2B7XPQ6_9EURO|nr:hypothetical protein AJ79_05195 [Helicocarpus griseus UAMH5409]